MIQLLTNLPSFSITIVEWMYPRQSSFLSTVFVDTTPWSIFLTKCHKSRGNLWDHTMSLYSPGMCYIALECAICGAYHFFFKFWYNLVLAAFCNVMKEPYKIHIKVHVSDFFHDFMPWLISSKRLLVRSNLTSFSFTLTVFKF